MHESQYNPRKRGRVLCEFRASSSKNEKTGIKPVVKDKKQVKSIENVVEPVERQTHEEPSADTSVDSIDPADTSMEKTAEPTENDDDVVQRIRLILNDRLRLILIFFFKLIHCVKTNLLY